MTRKRDKDWEVCHPWQISPDMVAEKWLTACAAEHPEKGTRRVNGQREMWGPVRKIYAWRTGLDSCWV